MNNRREFLGVVFTGCCLSGNLRGQARRQVTVAGRRIRTIDIHAHLIVPEATALMGVKTAADNASVMAPERLKTMDEWGTDM